MHAPLSIQSGGTLAPTHCIGRVVAPASSRRVSASGTKAFVGNERGVTAVGSLRARVIPISLGGADSMRSPRAREEHGRGVGRERSPWAARPLAQSGRDPVRVKPPLVFSTRGPRGGAEHSTSSPASLRFYYMCVSLVRRLVGARSEGIVCRACLLLARIVRKVVFVADFCVLLWRVENSYPGDDSALAKTQPTRHAG
eukprot:scaffold235548_cov27-Tisochrysis_lutea.AAC.1